MLSTRLESINLLAGRDAPQGLDNPEWARSYMLMADHWTRESCWPELLIDSFEEICWRTNLCIQERQTINRLRQQWGAAITPLRFSQEGSQGWLLSRWLQSDRRLIYREVRLSAQAQLHRLEQVRALDLPAYAGATWGLVNGRVVPTG